MGASTDETRPDRLSSWQALWSQSPADRDGTATCTRTRMAGSYVVDPDITYTVIDTLDFCPETPEDTSRRSSRPRCPATRRPDISGDVPFTVKVPAPGLTGAYGSEDA